LMKVCFLSCPINSTGVFLSPLVSHGSADTLITKITSLELHSNSLEKVGPNFSLRAQSFTILSARIVSSPETHPWPHGPSFT
jgi:hypothetical protein